MRQLRWLGLLLALGAFLAPVAHVLELPNKLQLDGQLWLGIQQHLYNGWAPLIGAPTELGGLAVSVLLLAVDSRRKPLLLLDGVAVSMFTAMLLCFFLLNDPVNKALIGWTPHTLPANWPIYRLRWEAGHALAAFFALAAAVAIGSSIFVAQRATGASK